MRHIQNIHPVRHLVDYILLNLHAFVRQQHPQNLASNSFHQMVSSIEVVSDLLLPRLDMLRRFCRAPKLDHLPDQKFFRWGRKLLRMYIADARN
jgi:hypothetical protein